MALMVYTLQFYLQRIPDGPNELGFLSSCGSVFSWTQMEVVLIVWREQKAVPRATSAARQSCPWSHQATPSLLNVLPLVPGNSSTFYSSRCSVKPCAQGVGALCQLFTAHITSVSRKVMPRLVLHSLQRCHVLEVIQRPCGVRLFILAWEKKENTDPGPHRRVEPPKVAHAMAQTGHFLGASSCQVLLKLPTPKPLGLVTAAPHTGPERPLLITLSRCSAREQRLFSVPAEKEEASLLDGKWLSWMAIFGYSMICYFRRSPTEERVI